MKKIVSIALLLSTTLSLFAGWEVTYRVVNMDGMINYDVMYIENHKLKYKGNDFEIILNTSENVMTIIFGGSNSYWSGSPDEFRLNMNLAMKKAMNEMMAQVPESQRAMYAEMLGGMEDMYNTPTESDLKSFNIKIKNTGEKDEIAEFSTEKYIVEVDGKVKESIWISSNINLSDDYNGREAHKMLLKFRPNLENETMHEFSDAYLGLMGKGLIMKSIGDENETVEAIKVVERDILPEELAIPEGYNLITIDELLQQQMMQSETPADGSDW